MNKNKLKSCIVREGYTAEVVAEKVGLSNTAFSRKVNGRSEFRLNEIQALIKTLCLDNDEVVEIFFA